MNPRIAVRSLLLCILATKLDARTRNDLQSQTCRLGSREVNWEGQQNAVGEKHAGISKSQGLSEYMTTLTFPDPHGGPDYSFQIDSLHMSWSQRIYLVELTDQTLNGTIHTTTMQALYLQAKAQGPAVSKREALREIEQTISFQREMLSQIYGIHPDTAGRYLRRRQQPDQTMARSNQSAGWAPATRFGQPNWQLAYQRWEPERDQFIFTVASTMFVGWFLILLGPYLAIGDHVAQRLDPPWRFISECGNLMITLYLLA